MTELAWFLVLLAAMTNYAGGYLIASRRHWSAANLARLTGVSAGFLLGVAIIDLLPETLGAGHQLSLWVLGGFFLVYLTERLLGGGHVHGKERGAGTTLGTWMGLLVHTFLDGVAIVAAYLIDPSMGLLVACGVLLHKAADGITMASVALSCRQGRRIALLATGSLGLATVLGAVSVSALHYLAPQAVLGGAHHFPPVAMALGLAAGSFLYVAATDLLAILHEETSLRYAPLYVMLGTLIFLGLSRALLALGGAHH